MSPETLKPSLLLVDDSEDDMFFFKRTLGRASYQCALCCASNGADAIAFFKEVSQLTPPSLPALVFLDLKMPIVNGFEVLEWLKDQSFFAQIHVIVLSGSESQNDKDRAASLGAKAYLVKPIRVADLDRLLAAVCPEAREKGAHA